MLPVLSCVVALETPLGGAATVAVDGPQAFSYPLPMLSREDRRAFAVGNSFFRQNWIEAPASASARDGLGPLFVARSCSACHAEDGRGRPPLEEGERGTGFVVRISPFDADGEPHPVYGSQIQDQAISGAVPEARVVIHPVRIAGRYVDGTPYELERLEVRLVDPAYGPLGALRTSPRVAQQLVGMGLLEAIDDATIVGREDPLDGDGDGISGRAARVRDPRTGAERIGRFGWKALAPDLEAQVAAALLNDIGITSPLHPDEALSAEQRSLVSVVSHGEPEIDAHLLGRIVHYCRTLAVPAQRDADDPRVHAGAALFERIGCAACHVPETRLGSSIALEAMRGETIRPYTDLLLHDMGEGLADDRREGAADGREWRTPPLWGIGLIETVNGHTRLLHDGRARSIEEAVLWHGGEAQRARDAFVALSRAEREAILAFLRSL